MSEAVYLINMTPFFGGGEVFLVRLAELLRDEKNITVVSPALPALGSRLADQDASFVELPGYKGLSIRWAFLRWLGRNRDTLKKSRTQIVLNGRGAAYLAPVVRLLHGMEPIVICHTMLSMRIWDIKEHLYGMAVRYARCVVAVSDTVAAQHQQRWPDLTVESIPNWVEVNQTAATAPPNDISPTTDIIKAALVARLAPKKGIEDVVAACAEEAGIELHVYGDGPLRDRLHEAGRDFSWLQFYGHVDDLPQRLPAHTILISGSYSESCPYSVAEGIQAGLLCVVSDIPAHRELLGQGYPYELFFPPGDLGALRQALQSARALMYKEHGVVARRVVSEAQSHIATHNSPKVARQRYLAVFSTARSGSAAP